MNLHEAVSAVVDEERVLVSIVEIDNVRKHPNADLLSLADIGGWQCCIKLDEMKKGEKALYCEIDSLLPLDNPIFAFLEQRKESLKSVNEKLYSRIKTIRLRKEISQGLLLPLPDAYKDLPVGTGLTQALGVLKYDQPVEKPQGYVAKKTWLDKLCFKIAGGETRSIYRPWPSFLTKTKEERVQNLGSRYTRALEARELFEVSYKLDGASMTAYVLHVEGQEMPREGVCSRNQEISTEIDKWGIGEQVRRWFASFLLANRRMLRIKRIIFPKWRKGVDPSDDDYVSMYIGGRIQEKLARFYRNTGVSVAIQGELCGPSIQKNAEKLNTKQFFVYGVHVLKSDIPYFKVGRMNPEQARKFAASLGLNYIPLLSDSMPLPDSIRECLKVADGKGAFGSPNREGLVFKSVERDFSFKVISNNYLLKNDD